MFKRNKLALTLMLGFFTSIFGCAQNKNTELVLTKENQEPYYEKGLALIEPYITQFEKSPPLDKNREAKLLEGIKYLDAVTQINPNNFAAFWIKGKAYQALKQHDNSFNEFEKSFELNKENPDVARELAAECLELGKGQKAVEVSLHALSLNEKDAGLTGNLALAYLFNGDLDLSRKTIQKAITAAPSDQIIRNLKKLIDDVVSGKRPQPKKSSDLKSQKM